MRQGHLDDFASVSADDLPELPDALGVGPVAVADGRGPFVEPGDIASFESARLTDGPDDRPVGLRREVADRGGLSRAGRLSHPAEDDAASGDTSGIPDVDRIDAGPGVHGKKMDMDIGYEAAQDIDEAVVFRRGSPEIRLLRVAQGFPLIPDIFLAEPGLAGVLEEKTLDRGDFGQGAKGHVRSLFHEYTVFESGLQRSAAREGPGFFALLVNFRRSPRL
jgi:hypothetical protein